MLVTPIRPHLPVATALRAGSPCWRLKHALGILAGLLLVSLLLAYAVRGVSPSRVLAVLGRLGGVETVFWVAVNLAVTAAMCIRWKVMVQCLGRRVPFLHLVRYRVAANAVSMLTPGPQFGGEPLQVFCLVRHHGMAGDRASASVAMDRVFELAFSFLLLGLGGLSLYRLEGVRGLPLWPMAVPAAFLLAAVAWAVAARRRQAGLFHGIASAGKARWAEDSLRMRWLRRLAAVEAAALRLLRQPLRVQAVFAGAALAHWLLIAAEFGLVYHFLGVPMEPLQVLAVVVSARLAFLLPLPAAIGALEGSQVFILGRMGFDPAAGLAACCLFRARDFLFVAWGVALALRWMKPRPSPLPEGGAPAG